MPIQLLINGLIAGSTYALVAAAITMIYQTSGFFHFAHGMVFTGTAYLGFLFGEWVGLPAVASFPLAVALGTSLGMVMDIALYRPLRHRGSSPLILLLVSLAVYVLLQNLISLAFGHGTRIMRSRAVTEGFQIAGAMITGTQLVTISVSLGVVVFLTAFARSTRTGKAMRAMASDVSLARASGIDTDLVIVRVFGIASAVAAVGGILVALDVDITPTMGMRWLMMGIVAAMIGGLGNVVGAALGALLLGFAQHFGVWKIGSQWQDAIAFVILLMFLIFRPEGFFGKKVRKATV